MPVRNPDNDLIAQEGSAQGDAYVMGHGDVDVVALVKLALDADKAAVLVDLSDTTNFPHSLTGKLRVYGIQVNTEVKADGAFILYLGVVTEVDGTDGSTKWIAALLLETVDNPTDSTGARAFSLRWPNGLDLEVSGGAPVKFLSNAGHTDNVAWQTDTDLDSPYGDAASPPGAGDLVAYLDETGGTGTCSFSITVEYIAEA